MYSKDKWRPGREFGIPGILSDALVHEYDVLNRRLKSFALTREFMKANNIPDELSATQVWEMLKSSKGEFIISYVLVCNTIKNSLMLI